MRPLVYEGKEILVTNHAIHRAKKRKIAYPDQVEYVLRCGSVLRFGKHGVKFVLRGKGGSIICIGQDIGNCIIIKTVERGN